VSEPIYKILAGVHRCVAARLAGLTEIKACIDDGGNLGPEVLIRLDAIVSVKSEIGRFDRNRDFHELLRIMANDVERERLEAIELMQISERHAKYFIRVADVRVNPF